MEVYYAQNREDLLIRSFFPDVAVGFYIDIGANHPVKHSVTKKLYDEGWSGINVEPIARLHRELVAARPRDVNLQVGIADRAGLLEFTEYPHGDGLSTFDRSMAEDNAASTDQRPTIDAVTYQVPVLTLGDLLQSQHVEHVHALKIDVEGFEYQVISGYDWAGIRPELLCVEALHIQNEWAGLLEGHRYREVFFDGLNRYYLAEESLHRLEFFDYASAVLPGPPVPYEIAEELRTAQAELREQRLRRLDAEARTHELDALVLQLRADLDRSAARVAETRRQVRRLKRQSRDPRWLRRRLTRSLKRSVNRSRRLPPLPTGHHYRTDPQVRALLQDRRTPAVELLELARQRDAVNVVAYEHSTRDRIRVGAWRVGAAPVRMPIRLLRKARTTMGRWS